MKHTAWVLNLHPDTHDVTKHWDCMHLWAAMDDLNIGRYQSNRWPFPEPPACVVIPGAAHAGEEAECYRAVVDAYGWAGLTIDQDPNEALVIITSDEASLFRWDEFADPFIGLWISTPRESTHGMIADRVRFFGEGPGPTPEGRWPDLPKTVDVSFAGQVTTNRRRAAVAAIRALPDSWATFVVETPGFMQGLDRAAYLNTLAKSRFVVCPSGAQTSDTFRCWEVLECGSIPICERRTPDNEDHGFWSLTFADDPPPFPIVDSWDQLERTLLAGNGWNALGWWDLQHACAEWYERQKQAMRDNLRADLGLTP